MALRDLILQKVKEEIQSDPQGVGYAGKTNAQILQLLNNAVRKQRVVEDHYPAPINRILAGIPETPNIISITDLIDALK